MNDSEGGGSSAPEDVTHVLWSGSIGGSAVVVSQKGDRLTVGYDEHPHGGGGVVGPLELQPFREHLPPSAIDDDVRYLLGAKRRFLKAQDGAPTHVAAWIENGLMLLEEYLDRHPPDERKAMNELLDAVEAVRDE
jgi:hypothetical protein